MLYSASPPPPGKWMREVMSGEGRVQDMKEVDLFSPQAARPLDLSLGVTQIRGSLLLQLLHHKTRALAPPLGKQQRGRGGLMFWRLHIKRFINSLSVHQYLEFLIWVVCLGGNSRRGQRRLKSYQLGKHNVTLNGSNETALITGRNWIECGWFAPNPLWGNLRVYLCKSVPPSQSREV